MKLIPLTIATLLASSHLNVAFSQSGHNVTTDSALTSQKSERLKTIKAELRALAHANAENKATRVRVRKIIDERLAELIEIQGEKSETEKANQSIGTWYQLWSDENNPQVVEPPNITKVESQVYQVITSDAKGYNFGLRKGSFGEAVFIIRFDISDDQDSKIVTFTNTYFRQGGFLVNESLSDLSNNITSGTAPTVLERPAPRFPNGPIGSQSPLFTNYIDSDFRVVTVPNSITNRLDMFILERTQIPLFDLAYQNERRAKETKRLKNELTEGLSSAKKPAPSAEIILDEVKKKTELLSLINPVSPDLNVPFQSLIGAWRLIWSNEKVSTDATPKLTQVYQIITESAQLINLGERQLPQGRVVFALTSPVSQRDNGFFIEFEKAFFRNSGFVAKENLVEIGRAIETDSTLAGFEPRTSGRFPSGPIGASDLLTFSFNDGLLRVTFGKNALTGTEEIFVLERAELAN